MIKLLTLKNVAPYAEDAVYKICLTLDKYGLCEDTDYENYEELLKSAAEALQKGEHIIVASETVNYNQLKETFLKEFCGASEADEELFRLASKNSDGSLTEADLKSHALLPAGAVCYRTMDGLYSGFTVKALSGTLTFMPLDFMRIDTVLQGFCSFMETGTAEAEAQEAEDSIEMPDYDFSKSVAKLVKTLSESERKVALVTSEATMWIYNLYSEIPSLTNVASFVEILDEPETEESEEEATSQSESVKLVGKARDAMLNAGANFGAAISEIYSVDDDEGNKIYFTYVAVVDKGVAKAKKLSTSNPDDLDLLLPHAVALLCDTVTQRAQLLFSNEAENESDSEDEEKEPEKKKLSKNMIIFAGIVLAIAIIIPVALFVHLMNDEPTTTTLPPLGTNPSAFVPPSSDVNNTTDPFAASSTTIPTQPGGVTQSTAVDISAPETTMPLTPSTKGLFTFYVFGYGHGVGMSQVGANYLAQQGWTAAEILAHYYYEPNAKIVTGEKYPDKITYNGSLYDTREYLASALESEMGSSFSYEALKAQAIALYTFAKYNNYNLSEDAHSYGKTPSELCYRVVDDVMNTGYYIAYGNDVAVTPFHAMSAGVTTSYYNVWGKGIGATVPYLAGGRKSYGDYLDSNYKSVFTITSDDLKAIVKEKLSVDLTGDPATWLTIVTHDKAVREDIGYVSSINVGGTIITGNEFRIKVLEGKIRSHCFMISYTPQS